MVRVAVGIDDQTDIFGFDPLPFHRADQALEAALTEFVDCVSWVNEDVGPIAAEDAGENIAMAIVPFPLPEVAI
jgi:hypothetical protein